MTKPNITPRRRAHLELLAGYLESLPEDYEHFDMGSYVDHHGSCDAIDGNNVEEVFSNGPVEFLSNCGAVACAIGHAPAAGIPLSKAHIKWETDYFDGRYLDIDWDAYAKRNFFDSFTNAWEWLFGGEWDKIDNHHWGAAARIRFLLAGNRIPRHPDEEYDEFFEPHEDHVALYQQYRKAA